MDSTTLRMPWIRNNPILDWEEDFSHENGNYSNKCCICGSYFLGHKRRVVCKSCDSKVVEPKKHLNLREK